MMTREEAIYILRNTAWLAPSLEPVDEAIEMAVEALEQTKWIPCSEKLPEAPTFCLVTTDGIYNDVIDIALYTSVGWHKASKVIAWMPMPKAYREDGEA